MTHVALWRETHNEIESSAIKRLDTGVTRSVENLGVELVTFLQVIVYFNVIDHRPILTVQPRGHLKSSVF